MNTILPWARVEALLERWGLPPSGTVAVSPEEARRAAHGLSAPFALKAISSRATHKSEHGLVTLDLSTADEVFDHAVAMSAHHREIEAFLVQPMVTGGVEMITGIVRDAAFGPLVVFGPGGVLVELLSDTRFLHPGFSRDDARYFLEAMAVHRLLTGYRSAGPFAIDRFIDHLVHLGEIARGFPDDLDSLDVNPVIVGTEAIHIVDIRVAGVANGA